MPLKFNKGKDKDKSKDKDVQDHMEKSPRLSLKSSLSSLNSRRSGSTNGSPGKLAKKAKQAFQRIADHVTRHNRQKQRVASDSSQAAIVPPATNALLVQVGSESGLAPSGSDDAVTPVARQRTHGETEGEGSRQGGPWEAESDADRHVTRRSFNLVSSLPRTLSSSESATTTIDRTTPDSGTFVGDSLEGYEKSKDQILVAASDPPKDQFVVVEEITPEEIDQTATQQNMIRDPSGPLEPSSGEVPFDEEEGAKEAGSTGQPSSSDPPLQDVITEPEVPDPFLVDEEGDILSEEERNAARPPAEAVSELQEHSTPAHEISLLPQEVPEAVTHSIPPSPAVDKDVPPLPSAGSDREEIPELSVPALIKPGMFLPIPNTDPLTTLLSKYIYPPEKRPVRDLTGDWQRSDFHTLVMTNSWRALARMARDHLISTSPEDVTKILNLWYIRLSSLARLRLFNQTSAECTNLFAVLNAVEPPEDRAWLFDNILPFELEIMHARLKYWTGDHMGYLDALNALLHKCKAKARQAGREAAAPAASEAVSAEGSLVTAVMWKERGVRVCLIMASLLAEMKDIAAAAKLIEPLCEQPNQPLTAENARDGTPNTSIPALRSALGRMYLQSGNLHMAARHFAAASKDPAIDPATKEMNAALFACADGQWERAATTLRGLLEKDAENLVAVNNLAVALLGQGKVQEGISTLENALKTSPSSVVVAEPFLFNLSTLYELRYASAIEKKRDLLVEVAKWSGDGLRTSCLKMPTT